MLKKIVIIGPESTGKSSLCETLAAHYNTGWCREYAREYLLKNGTKYKFDDLLEIAQGQLKGEDACMETLSRQQKELGFIDTDMYVMKVWCEFVFDKCHSYILNEIVNRKYDLYLLCNTDLPWVKDELREYPDLKTRETLFRIYKDILINQSTPWIEISGQDMARVQIAIHAIDSL